jgi:predicted RecB family nuclease
VEPEEARIIGAWLAHMHEVCGARGTTLDAARIFHWSPAEESSFTEAYNSAAVRHGFPPWDDLPWADRLNRVVKEQPVAVCGAFGFGLKAVAKALRRHGLIETEWTDGPTDGLGAMIGAWWCHHEAARQGVPMPHLDLMQEIERYNEIDCKVMAEVLSYLRQNR